MKRLLSILLCSAMLVTALPGMYYSQGFGCETVYAQENESTVQEIDYQLNGGHYVSGYKAPLNYPVAELPDKDKVINQGYEFGGWYDNAELTGEPVTKINQGDYTGVVVLYAKWVERYYYIDIPQSVDTFAGGTGEVQVAGHAGGLYEKDKVSVSVSSDNEWKLISKNSANVDIRLGYGLYTDDNNEVLADNSVVSELTATGFDKAKKYFIRLTDTPEYAGTYSDSLTFDIAFETTKYNIKYVTNGGTLYSKEKDEQQRSIELKEETYEAGTSLSSLPSPGKEGAVFLGWCYDSSCTEYVSSDDRLLSDVVLYAAWTDTQELRTVSLETYARSYDVDANDFSITITDKTGSLTADEVSGLIKIKNTSDMLDEISAFVSAKAVLDGEYTFSINNSEGWQQGSSYRLELDDDRLYFTGYDTTIREYDFTVYKPDVRNTELNKDIKYISSGSISDLMVDGKAADSISVSAMTVGVDGTITDSTKVTGSFTYVNDTLSLGDKIAVYEGNVILSLDTEAVTDDDVSFFEITSADDSRYTYRGLAAKEILFVPDVLPVNIKDDKDNDVGNNSVIIAQDKLTYDNVDAKDNPSLGEDTTIDNGDYLALYNDGDDNIQYAVITEVSKTDTDYIIVYSEVSWEEVQAAMDIYQTDSINGDTILKNQDTEEIERSVEQQAVDSGFAQSVADEVARAVVMTDSYQELSEYLSDNLGADISVSAADGYSEDAATQVMDDGIALYAGDNKPAVKLDHVNADLSTRLQHFDDISGLRLALDIGVEIELSNIKVVVSATFEQEVKMNINVSGKAVWKKWKDIIPYIDDYSVAVSLDLYDYTGINFNVDVTTSEGDDEEDDENTTKLDTIINNIAEELKNMMELGTTYISDNSDISTRLEDIGDIGKDNDDDEDKEISVAKSLAERYSDMLDNESDWVELYSKALTESHVRVIGIIDVEFKVEFVVSANVNISMGMTYWYKNGKRYVYSILVFSKNVTSDTIDLSEEQYEFSVYAIGTVGIRAGIRLSAGVGLISTRLASVGFSSEVGGYAQIWGYLYYQLKYAASAGRSASSMGAIYMEVGVYMQVDFLAQAFAGTFSYNPTLFEKQWPLYSVGVVENVCDFTYGQGEYKDIKLKRDIKAVRIPSTYFSMQYLDMKEGLDDNDEYFNKIYDDDSRYYVITMTNPAFTYDPLTNVISVDPGDEPEQDGEMIITWKSQKGSFNTKPITRKVSLHWDNLRDGYYIAFQTNGGSIVDTVVAKYGKEIAKPADPVKAGYTFAGWYQDEAFTKKYEVPDTMPDEDRIVYAKWEASDMTYSVVDYVEGTDGVYNVAATRSETAKTDETISVQPAERSGFITPPALSQVIKADGGTKFNYYYARNKYNIKFISEGEVVSEGSYTYGTQMPTPSVYRPGYDFAGWEPEVSYTVSASDMTYTAVWKESDDVVYTTKYYLENENGGYVLDRINPAKGTTGQAVTAAVADYDEDSYTIVKDMPSGTVNADGSLVLKVYYDRSTYNITYDTTGEKLDNTTQAVKWGTKVITQVPEKAGYAFAGWYTDKECTESFNEVMPKADITLYAKWDKSKVNYTVEHYMETTDGSSYELEDRQVYVTDVESEVTPEVKNVKGFTAPDKQTVKVNSDSSTVIKYYYKRNIHKLTLKYNNGEDDGVYEYRYGTRLSVGQPLRKGYIFAGWDKDIAGVMPDEDVTYTAGWNIAQFTISFKTDGGNEVESITQDYNTGITAPANPVKKGYTFTGWDKKIPDFMPAENMLLTAQWSKDVYNITYNLNGGEADNPDTYQVDSSVITLKTPVRKGYTFTGWSGTGIDGISENVVITTGSTGGRTYTANWTENSYTIQFMPYGDGTTGSMDEMSLMYTDETSLSANVFARPGYTFEGWSVEAGGEKKYDDEEVVSGLKSGNGERMTLYPVWTANEYTVHFDAGSGKEIEDAVYTYDKEYELPVTTRSEYRFMGWCVEDGGAVIYLPGVSASNLAEQGEVTLYASWLKVEFNYSDFNSYHITDNSKEEPVKYHFIIGGSSADNSSTNGGRTNTIFMDGISLEEIKRVCSTMTFTITYKLDMDDDGYVDMDTTYRRASDGKWCSFKEEDIDIKKNNGNTLTYTYSINLSDVDAICYRFDAHGKGSDKYWLRNIRFNARFN